MLGEPPTKANPEEGNRNPLKKEEPSPGTADRLAGIAQESGMKMKGPQINNRPADLAKDVFLANPIAKARLLMTRLDQIIEDRRPVPSLGQLRVETGLSKTAIQDIILRQGYNDDLEELRQEWRETSRLFPQTEEVAWFLGMLVGTNGSVEENPPSLTFTDASERKRRAFRLSGKSILGEAKPGIKGHDGRVKVNANPSVRFHSKDHVEAIGDFHRGQKTDTIWGKHDWVMGEPYLTNFASGVFDSSGVIVLNDLKVPNLDPRP